VPDWERLLGSLVDDLSRTADRDVEQFPLALQFTLEHRRVYSYRDDGPVLGIRPLRPGAKQAWIKGGADWSDIPGAVLARRLLPEHADTVGALHGALQRHRGYQAAGISPTLAQFGPHLPRLLRAAETAADRSFDPGEAGPDGGRDHQRRHRGADDARPRRGRRGLAR
jgi:hypothetical protein